jgi:hypothetical protein
LTAARMTSSPKVLETATRVIEAGVATGTLRRRR